MTECRPVWAAAPADVHFHTTQSEMKKRKVKKKKISTVHPILCRGKSSKGKKKLKGADYCFQYFYFSFLPSSFSARERERSLKVIWLRVVVHPPSPPTIEKRGTNSKGAYPQRRRDRTQQLEKHKIVSGFFSIPVFVSSKEKKKKCDCQPHKSNSQKQQQPSPFILLLRFTPFQVVNELEETGMCFFSFLKGDASAAAATPDKCAVERRVYSFGVGIKFYKHDSKNKIYYFISFSFFFLNGCSFTVYY